MVCMWACIMNLCIDMDDVGKQLDIQVSDIDHSDHVKSAFCAAGKESRHRSICHTLLLCLLWCDVQMNVQIHGSLTVTHY